MGTSATNPGNIGWCDRIASHSKRANSPAWFNCPPSLNARINLSAGAA
jgi:hypothetical protein